jgi:hypothetical protein
VSNTTWRSSAAIWSRAATHGSGDRTCGSGGGAGTGEGADGADSDDGAGNEAAGDDGCRGSGADDGDADATVAGVDSEATAVTAASRAAPSSRPYHHASPISATKIAVVPISRSRDRGSPSRRSTT